jgi:hypothetical protein
MGWMRERDAWIAQTLAFVQSVTRKRDKAGEPLGSTVPEKAKTPPVPANASVAIARPSASSSTPSRPMVSDDIKSEFKARIDRFRAHQERFNREREAYFSATLEKLRAAIKDTPPLRPGR